MADLTEPDLEGRVAGALMGVIIGDAVGAPHEFRHGPRYQDGYLATLTVVSQYHPIRTGVRGQVTDDTEMTWALIRALIDGAGYHHDLAVAEYLRWANGLNFSGKRIYPLPPMMGKNTRRLFQGIKTLKSYYRRATEVPSTESNGCMMRCIPLLFFSDQDLEEDVRLTNDNDVCVAACLALKRIFQGLVGGLSVSEALGSATGLHRLVDQAIEAGQRQTPRDLVSSKGWVVHPIYVLSVALTTKGATVEAMREVLRFLNLTARGCDSDTIGAIVLGVMGGVIGRERLMASPYFAKMFEAVCSVDSVQGELPRPSRYQPSNLGLGSEGEYFDDLVEALVRVIKTQAEVLAEVRD